MKRFEAEKGFVHLVFAQEDEYYLKSLICLNLRQLLYYELKKEYRGIYFVSGSKEEYLLEIPDETSCEYYRESVGNKGFHRWFKTAEQEIFPGEKIAVAGGYENDFRQKIYRILKKQKKQAFVFSIESFSELFSEKEQWQELQELKKRCLGKSIFLIQAPPTMTGSFFWLTQEQGWFRNWLCPGIFDESNGKYEKVYEKIQETMGECCRFLNGLDRYELRWMMRRYLLEHLDSMTGKLYLSDAYADFIYAWYHSEKLREKTGKILPDNERHLISEIRKRLEHQGVFENLESWIFRFVEINGTSEHILEKLQLEYPQDVENNYVCSDSPLLRKLNRAPIPEGHPAPERCREKYSRLLRELQIPRLAQQQIEKNIHLCTCLQHLQEASEKGDVLTYEKSLDALEYGLLRAERIGKSSDEIWEIKDRIIMLSEYIWLFSEQIKEDDERIAEFTEEREKIQQEIKERDGKRQGAFTNLPAAFQKNFDQKITGDRISLNSQMQMAISLKEQVEIRKKQRAVNLQTKNEYLDRIRQMEQAVSQMILGKLSINNPDIDETIDKFQENLIASLEASQKARESTGEIRLIMEEWLDRSMEEQKNEQEIAEEYRRMLLEEENEGREDITC